MSKQSTGLVRDLIKIPEWSGNDLMRRFVRQVESSPIGTDIAPFWIKEKPGMRYRTSQASQAAIVAAYRSGLLSCSGKPGRMKFYHTDATGFHTPFSKVNSLLKVMLTMFLFWQCLVLPLAHLNSAVADKVLWVLGIFACLAYGNRAFSYMAYKPLFLFTPGHGGNARLTAKIGLYLISTMWSIGLMIALYIRSGDHTLELTLAELLASYPSLAWDYLAATAMEYATLRFFFELDFWVAVRALVFFFMPFIAGFGTGMFAAFYADGGSPAALSSTRMMERFCADPVGNRQINHYQKGFIFAAGLSVYWVLQFIVWIDISLIK